MLGQLLGRIDQPMTMFTDYVLAVECLLFATLLVRKEHREHPARVFLLVFFVFTAIATAVGGTVHGFMDILSEPTLAALWRVTVLSMGPVTFSLLVGSGRAALPPHHHRVLLGIGVAQLVIYSVWIWGHSDFVFVVVNYAPVLLAALIMQARDWRVRGTESGKWLSWGLVATFVSSGVQVSGFSISEHLNYNDIYHIIDMVALWFFYRGAKVLRDRAQETVPA